MAHFSKIIINHCEWKKGRKKEREKKKRKTDRQTEKEKIKGKKSKINCVITNSSREAKLF